MGLTSNNALVSIAIGGGAAAPQASGATLAATSGIALTFSLQSTALVQTWELSIQSDDATLNGKTFTWNRGQQNALTVPTPTAPFSASYQSLVSDGNSSTASLRGFIVGSNASGGGGGGSVLTQNFTQPASLGASAVAVMASGTPFTSGSAVSLADGSRYVIPPGGVTGNLVTLTLTSAVTSFGGPIPSGTVALVASTSAPLGATAPGVGTALVLDATGTYQPGGHHNIFNLLTYFLATDTDYTAAFTRMVAAKDAAGGGVMIVPAGRYKKNGTINLGSAPCTLAGDGVYAIAVQQNNSYWSPTDASGNKMTGSIIYETGTGNGGFFINPGTSLVGITIRDLGIVGPNSSTGTGISWAAYPVGGLVRCSVDNVVCANWATGFDLGNAEEISTWRLSLFGNAIGFAAGTGSNGPTNCHFVKTYVEANGYGFAIGAAGSCTWYGGLCQSNTNGWHLIGSTLGAGASTCVFDSFHIEANTTNDLVIDTTLETANTGDVTFSNCYWAGTLSGVSWTATDGSTGHPYVVTLVGGNVAGITGNVPSYLAVRCRGSIQPQLVSTGGAITIDFDYIASTPTQGQVFSKGWTLTESTIAVGHYTGLMCTRTGTAAAAWIAYSAFTPSIGRTCTPVPDNGHFYTVSTSGMCGTTQPVFNTGAGSTTTDFGAVWTESGTAVAWTPTGYIGGINTLKKTTTVSYKVDTAAALAATYGNGWVPDAAILVNAAAALTITLPNPALWPMRRLPIKDIAGNAAAKNITIAPFASETIDGAASYVLNLNFAGVVLESDGTNWWVMSSYNGTVI